MLLEGEGRGDRFCLFERHRDATSVNLEGGDCPEGGKGGRGGGQQYKYHVLPKGCKP